MYSNHLQNLTKLTIVIQLIRSFCKKWTLAFLFQRTFYFNSPLWSDRTAYNLARGQTGFDSQETKLPTYWNTPFLKICLCMRVGQQTNFFVMNRYANSLFSLIADGNYRASSLGRNMRKTLVGSRASLQLRCDKEGFNTVSTSSANSKARIRILANNENDCRTADSRIGFGTGGRPDDSNMCGNEAIHRSDNGNQHIKAMGYVLVQ